MYIIYTAEKFTIFLILPKGFITKSNQQQIFLITDVLWPLLLSSK